MELNGIKLRWINYAGYEILLPNGKTVIVDPSLTMRIPEEERKEIADKFYTHGCDYVIISHVHADHVNDLPTIFEKYSPKVFVGAQSAYDLMELYDIPVNNMYPVYPNETYELDGMKLQTFHSKHKMNPPRPNQNAEYASELDRKVSRMGSIEYMDYCLTLEDNTSLFFSGGGVPEWSFQNVYEDLKKTRPNILFRQTTSKWTPEEFAHLIAQWHPQIVLPLHQDGLAKASGMSLEEYFSRTNAELTKIGSNAVVLNADSNQKWFEIKTKINVEVN